MKKMESYSTIGEQLKKELERLRVVTDGIDEIIYVIDPDTYEILFANKKTKELFGKKTIGKKCYEVFQNLNRPCPSCTNNHLFGENLEKTHIRGLQNQRNKRWYKCVNKAIKQSGGKYVQFGIAIDVTEQKEMEEALRESEQLFRSVVDNSHDCILIIDDNFRIIYANDEAIRLSGYSKEEIIGQDFRKFLDENSKAMVEERYMRRQRRESVPPQYNFKIVRKDGEKRDVEIKSTAIRDKHGKTRTIAQLLDISENKRIEDERKRFEEQLSALNMYGQSLNRAKNMEEVYKLTLDAMEKTLGFEFADIFIIDGKMLCLVVHRGYSKNLSLKLPLDGKKGITVRAVRVGKPVYVPDVRKEKTYVGAGVKGMLSELAVPIKIGNRVLGVLNVESKRLSAFDKEDEKLLEILASHAATAIGDLKRQEKLKIISKKLTNLMKSSTEIMNPKDMRKRLKVIAKAILKFGWRRAVISLRDENLKGIELVTAGLTKEETRLLLERKAPGHVWRERLGPKFERFKIGEFYCLPWSDPWIRENVHGVPPGTSPDAATTYTGVPSKLSPEEMVDWHPQDMLYAPLRTPEGRIVGILSMDDPIDGRRPTRESLTPLELFLHQAAITIENAQLIDSLRKARKQLEEYAGQLEQKVEERTRELKKSQEQLLKAQRLAVIGELAGMVGHDLRNPLTSISGAEYYLKKRLSPEVDSKIKEMLVLIEKNIAYSNKIINDLLDYSREIELELMESNSKLIVKEALSLVEIPKNVRTVDLTENKPKIMVDVGKIKRAFVNIIKNAVEAMPKGGTLTIKSRKLEGNLEIVVSDTGAGMSKETLEKLWAPLFTTKAKGMGFGLPICKRFIEAHGGSISAKSTPRKGTTFTVRLPIEPKIEKGGEKVWVKPLESSLLTTTKT
jgi:PAS domain S-box-containing protein